MSENKLKCASWRPFSSAFQGKKQQQMLRKNQDLKAWLMTSTLSFKNHPVRIEMQHVSLWNTKIFYSINSHSNFHSWLNPYLIIQCEIFSIPRYKARTVLQSVILVLLSFSSFRVYFNHQIYQNVSSKSEQKKKKNHVESEN